MKHTLSGSTSIFLTAKSSIDTKSFLIYHILEENIVLQVRQLDKSPYHLIGFVLFVLS